MKIKLQRSWYYINSHVKKAAAWVDYRATIVREYYNEDVIDFLKVDESKKEEKEKPPANFQRSRGRTGGYIMRIII